MVHPLLIVERRPMTALLTVLLCTLEPWAMMASVTLQLTMVAGGRTRGEVYMGLWGS